MSRCERTSASLSSEPAGLKPICVSCSASSPVLIPLDPCPTGDSLREVPPDALFADAVVPIVVFPLRARAVRLFPLLLVVVRVLGTSRKRSG